MMKGLARAAAATFVLVLGAGVAGAQTSADYAKMAAKAYAAFRCAALASQARNDSEHKRLFALGYGLGKRFLNAWADGKVTKQDVGGVPIGITLYLEGPSADFMLGRIYEGAVESALKDLGAVDLWQMNAENKYRQQNCSLISE